VNLWIAYMMSSPLSTYPVISRQDIPSRKIGAPAGYILTLDASRSFSVFLFQLSHYAFQLLVGHILYYDPAFLVVFKLGDARILFFE